MWNRHSFQEGYTIVEVLTALVLLSLSIVISITFFQLVRKSALVKDEQVYQLAVNQMESLLAQNTAVCDISEVIDRWQVRSQITEENAGLQQITVSIYRNKTKRLLYTLATSKIVNYDTENEEL